MAEKDDLAGQIVLMVGVALDELAMIEGEPDLAKVRTGISSVRSTLRELFAIATKAKEPPSRLGL